MHNSMSFLFWSWFQIAAIIYNVEQKSKSKMDSFIFNIIQDDLLKQNTGYKCLDHAFDGIWSPTV